MTEKQIKWQKRNRILWGLKGMVSIPSYEEGVLIPFEEYRLTTAFSIIKKVIQDSVKSSIELGFNAIADASRELKIPTTNISKCCKGLRKSAGNFIWKYGQL